MTDETDGKTMQLVDQIAKEALQQGFYLGFLSSGQRYNGEHPFADKDPAEDEEWLRYRDRFMKIHGNMMKEQHLKENKE